MYNKGDGKKREGRVIFFVIATFNNNKQNKTVAMNVQKRLRKLIISKYYSVKYRSQSECEAKDNERRLLKFTIQSELPLLLQRKQVNREVCDCKLLWGAELIGTFTRRFGQEVLQPKRDSKKGNNHTKAELAVAIFSRNKRKLSNKRKKSCRFHRARKALLVR